MKYKLIACNMFRNELEHCLPASPHDVAVTYLELGEHARPNELRKKLQAQIDDYDGADAVLLCYGLCGRATEGLVARDKPLVLIRSHDCGGILLGSRKHFEEVFKDMPSTPFSSIGIVEKGNYFFDNGELVTSDCCGDDGCCNTEWDNLVKQYGEEDAKYIMEIMRPKLDGALRPIYFITMPEIDAATARAAAFEAATNEGREFKDLGGSIRLIRMLLNGDHPADEFLTVPPGSSIRQVGDWDEIIKIV